MHCARVSLLEPVAVAQTSSTTTIVLHFYSRVDYTHPGQMLIGINGEQLDPEGELDVVMDTRAPPQPRYSLRLFLVLAGF